MIIDIKIVLDTALLWQRHPNLSRNLNAPTEIEPEEAFVVAAPKQNVYRHASDNLELVAGKGDVLHLRISLTARDMFHVILYNIIADPTDIQQTTIPEIAVTSRSFPVPNTKEPTLYAESQRTEAYFECEVSGYGKQFYKFLFCILEQNEVDGCFNTVGYFSWRPTLVIREV